MFFRIALQKTGRASWKQWLNSQNVDEKDDKALAIAKQRWDQVRFLDDPSLMSLAYQALSAARGSIRDGSEHFPATIWRGGVEDVWNGDSFTGTIADFSRLLQYRSQVVAQKGKGWVIEPTTNPKGRRTNEETHALHALFLDCDGTGKWDKLLSVLDSLNFCYIAYQSGGYTDTIQKWRIVFPLSSPHITTSEEARQAWKNAYNYARVVFGACAELHNVGFDPNTDTPCSPWFITEKRSAEDSPRQVVWRYGHSLDLTGLILALPEFEPAEVTQYSKTSVSPIELDNPKLEQIISALAKATSRISSGRRDIYLSLPGVLLDRGVSPEDVLTIIESVSERYPRSHPEKHIDNVNCARTTIAKWESKSKFTRIGTLNSIAPEIATVLDSILPDGEKQKIIESMRSLLGEKDVPIQATPSSVTVMPTDRKSLRKILVKLRRKKVNQAKETKDPKKAIDAALLNNLLEGNSLVVGGLDRLSALSRVAGILAFHSLDSGQVATTLKAVDFMEFFRKSIYNMLDIDERPESLFKIVEDCYLGALKKRIDMRNKSDAKIKENDEVGR